jgi:hypothetical protein
VPIWIEGVQSPDIPKSIEACLLDLLDFGRKCLGNVEEVPHILGDVFFQTRTSSYSLQVIVDGVMQVNHPLGVGTGSHARLQIPMRAFFITIPTASCCKKIFICLWVLLVLLEDGLNLYFWNEAHQES